MTYTEILENLCYYDLRNPNTDMTQDDIDEHNEYLSWRKYRTCSCDNCFYGRTKLANELLKYIKDDTV